MPLYIPTGNVKATVVSGTDVSDGGAVEVYPLGPNTLSGVIEDGSGSVDASFDGTVEIQLFDAPVEVKTIGQNASATDVTLDDDCLSSVTTRVTGGRFETELIVPESARPGENARLSFYASSDDGRSQASGQYASLVIKDYDPAQVSEDNQSPGITAFYLDAPDFANGGVVGRDAVVHIEIAADATGLYTSTSRFGQIMTLLLDGKQADRQIASAVKPQTDDSYIVEWPIYNMGLGRHTLALSLSDNAGNIATRTIEFVVADLLADAILSIEEQPARTQATFTLEGIDGSATGRLIVENEQGATVLSRENVSFPYTWNLMDAEGNSIPDGRYDCYAILKSGRHSGGTAKAKLIVVKQ